jgi:LysM repeat protein
MFFGVIVFTQKAIAQRSVDIETYISSYRLLAIAEMQRSGVPAAITLAQGIHETMAGTSDLVLKSNNHFGIKCKSSWEGEKVYHDDDARGECFRRYQKAEESYRDHSDFLKYGQRYAFLFTLDPLDYKGWAFGLKKAGYATNIKYSYILIKLIEEYNLQDYSLIALGKQPPLNETVAVNNTIVSAENELPPRVANATPQYLPGVFAINNTKVIFAKSGTSLFAIAEQYDLLLARLLDFNDITEGEGDILAQDQLVFLQRKRKVGGVETHTVQPGEILYDIAQAEGIRYENLLALNNLKEGMRPATGEKIYLQYDAPQRPLLAGEKKDMATVDVKLPVIIKKNNSIKHIVQSKETLYSISRKYEVPVTKIIEWNKLTVRQLKVGQLLTIYKN